MGALHQCHEADYRGCSKEECISCRSIRTAKAILKKYPLDKAWVEEEFYEKAYSRKISTVLPGWADARGTKRQLPVV